MPHFMQLIDSKCLGALNFVDADMRPTQRDLTIRRVVKGKPPAGGKERWEFHFQETEKTAFFANGQVKRLANMLMCANTEGWVGVRLTVTCGPVKSPKGGETMGMIIVEAVKPGKQERAESR